MEDFHVVVLERVNVKLDNIRVQLPGSKREQGEVDAQGPGISNIRGFKH